MPTSFAICNAGPLIRPGCILESLLGRDIALLFPISQVKCGPAGNKEGYEVVGKKSITTRERVSHDSLMQPVILCYHVLLNQLCHAVSPPDSLAPNAAWYVVRTACLQINSTRTLFFMQITNTTGSSLTVSFQSPPANYTTYVNRPTSAANCYRCLESAKYPCAHTPTLIYEKTMRYESIKVAFDLEVRRRGLFLDKFAFSPINSLRSTRPNVLLIIIVKRE